MTSITSNSIGLTPGTPTQWSPPTASAGEPASAPAAQVGLGTPAQNPQPASLAQPSQPNQSAQPSQPTQPQPNAEQLKRVTEALRVRATIAAPELQFTIDQSTGKSLIKVVDRATKEVLLQIPSEETLRIDKALDQYQQGLLIDRKA